MGTVDRFLTEVPAGEARAFAQVRSLAESAVPAVEQGTSYGVPALIYRGRPLLGFASGKAHLSIFPFSPAVVDAVRARLEGYSLAKGTIRFTVETPLPDEVVTDVARLRRDEIDAALQ